MTAAFVVFAAPTSAMADESWYDDCVAYASSVCQTGVQVGGPAGEDECATASADMHYTRVCINFDGDYVYVKDGKEDTHSAIAAVTGGTGSVTGRYCRNPYGNGTWARCNFDWTESGEKRVYGGYRVSDSLVHATGAIIVFTGN
ncbi:hypothetical protein [Plantactinospora mayteni]|uniref:hypothetical protein n=1 Tax=Plantactinospora mayteni TaxID=566021 RepID=UPI0031E6B0A7